MGWFIDPGELSGRVVETGTTNKIYPENGASKEQLKRFDETMVYIIKKFGPKKNLTLSQIKRYLK